MSTFVTGDLHGQHDFWKLEEFAEWSGSQHLTKDDYLIVAGDFGLLWYPEGDERDDGDGELREWLENQRWTTLFVDGNHECYQRLYSYPVDKWHGGDVHKISPSIYHLMRGQIFDIEGNKIFTMGGAYSHDRQWRVKGRSWWEEEVPSIIERNRAIENLDANNWTVDYVVSHAAPIEIARVLVSGRYDRRTDEYEDWLQKKIADNLTFKKWYFGHYHMGITLGDNDEYCCLYNSIVKLGW